MNRIRNKKYDSETSKIEEKAAAKSPKKPTTKIKADKLKNDMKMILKGEVQPKNSKIIKPKNHKVWTDDFINDKIEFDRLKLDEKFVLRNVSNVSNSLRSRYLRLKIPRYNVKRADVVEDAYDDNL